MARYTHDMEMRDQGSRSSTPEPLVLDANGAEQLAINAHILFDGTYARSGLDLTITTDAGDQVVVEGYFADGGGATNTLSFSNLDQFDDGQLILNDAGGAGVVNLTGLGYVKSTNAAELRQNVVDGYDASATTDQYDLYTSGTTGIDIWIEDDMVVNL